MQSPKQSSHDCPQNLTAGMEEGERQKESKRERESVCVCVEIGRQMKCKRAVQAVR